MAGNEYFSNRILRNSSRWIVLILYIQVFAIFCLSQEECPSFNERLESCSILERSQNLGNSYAIRRFYVLIDEEDFVPYKLNSVFEYFSTKYADIQYLKVKIFSSRKALDSERFWDLGTPSFTSDEARNRYVKRFKPTNKGYLWAFYERKAYEKPEFFIYNRNSASEQFLVLKVRQNKNFDSPRERLFYSSEYGDLDGVKESIDKISDIDAKDRFNLPAIYYTLAFYHNKIAKLLVEKGANPNIQIWDDTPLVFVPIENQNHEGVELLLRNGADADLRNRRGMSALTIALKNCDIEMIKILIGNSKIKQNIDKNRKVILSRLSMCPNGNELKQQLLMNIR